MAVLKSKLTKSVVDSLPYPTAGQVLYRNTELIGFGVRIGTKTKTYFAETKIHGKTVRVSIGKHGVFTPEQARTEARHLLGQMAKGINPVDVAKEKRLKGVTLGPAFEDYLRARKSLKPNTLYDYKKCMRLYFPDWQQKPLLEITKDMVERRHQRLGARSQAQANLAMRFLRAVFNFAAERYQDSKGRSVIAENPVKRLSKTRAWYRVERRSNYIRPHELKPWFKAVMTLNNDSTGHKREVVRDYLLLLLFTGLRRQEAARLVWDEVDFQSRTLTVTDTKNREHHVLPLSDFLYELLERRKREPGTSPYVFPGEGTKGHLVEPRKQWQRVIRESGIDFTLHDLRRTFATAVNNLERSLSAYSIKRLLNHKTQDVTAGYIQHDIESLREPMQQVTDYILKCAGLKASAQVLTLEDRATTESS